MKYTQEQKESIVMVLSDVLIHLNNYNRNEWDGKFNQIFICNLIKEVTDVYYSNELYNLVIRYLHSEEPSSTINTKFTEHKTWNGGFVWWTTTNDDFEDWLQDALEQRKLFVQHIINKLMK